MSKLLNNFVKKAGVFFMVFILALTFLTLTPVCSDAKTTGWLYGDALVIGNPDSPVYKISAAGVLSGTGVASQTSVDAAYKSLTATYGITGATGTLSSTLSVGGNVYLAPSTAYTSTFTASNGNLHIVGIITGATVNTGLGANELYDMNQNVQTTDAVTFRDAAATYGVTGATGTFSGALSGLSVTASGGAIKFYSRSEAQILAIDPGGAGEAYYCNDCTTTAVCISTGTAVLDFAAIEDPTAICD